MKLPNLLATRRGRLVAFFFLYLTEGIPLGFTATAVATQMRRQGLEPAVIGAFVGSLYAPWAIKWAFGPFVDVLSSDRWGRRRGWILLTQLLMMATLLAAMPVSFKDHLALFTALIFVHNLFSATQDVAIDALAVNVLHEDERGLANGLMFGGQYLGQAVGGSGVLFLTPLLGFSSTFVFVAAAIGVVTLCVALPMRETTGPPRVARAGSVLRGVATELARFARDAGKAFLSSRASIVAVFVALLPMGAMALGLSLQSNLAVELGLSDPQIGVLTLGSTLLSGGFCVLGGWLSDRFGRRRTLALFIAAMSLPTIAMAIAMHQFGWIMPVSPQTPNRPVPPGELVTLFRALVWTYASFQGLMYGVGTAIFMDVTTARVAATQFTAYMAMTNFAISYSATWQGHALQRLGYPTTLALDAVLGVVSLALLPLMGALGRRPREGPVATVPEGVLP
jgi:MFS family permease